MTEGLVAADDVIAPKDAMQRVRAADAAHRAKTAEINKLSGSDEATYERLRQEEKATWEDRRAARRALRQHIHDTYGVDVHDLKMLSQG